MLYTNKFSGSDEREQKEKGEKTGDMPTVFSNRGVHEARLAGRLIDFWEESNFFVAVMCLNTVMPGYTVTHEIGLIGGRLTRGACW